MAYLIGFGFLILLAVLAAILLLRKDNPVDITDTVANMADVLNDFSDRDRD